MPLKGNDAEQINYYIQTSDDVFQDGNDGSIAGKATPTIIKSIDIGQRSDNAATSDTSASSFISLFKRLLSNKLSGVAENLAKLGTAINNAKVDINIKSTESAVPITDNNSSLTVDNSGTFAVQVSSPLPTGTNSIGSVGVGSLPIDTGTGNISSNTTRVVVASNQVVPVSLGALPAGANNIGSVNIGTTPFSTGSGNSDAGTVRVALASNISIPQGSNTIGNVGLASSLPTGTNTIGAVNLNTLWGIPSFDSIVMTYDGSSRVSTITYRRGTTALATLTLAYDTQNNITSVTRSPLL